MKNSGVFARVRRGVAVAGLAVGLAVGASVAIAGPASAAPLYSCADGDACLWRLDSFRGYVGTGGQLDNLRFANCIDNLAWYGYDNTVSSVVNNGRTDSLYIYRDAYKGGGAPLWMARGTAKATMGAWDNIASSVYFSSRLSSSGSSTCR
ncbi:peptidase inhibitor family I36 protein [Microbacterium paraoxydans]|uniref:peptidase inhibitor family I36 protein n=1 Tax=Microbacterium paraoxydans TaxID=199592 RepID=UPI003C6D1F18